MRPIGWLAATVLFVQLPISLSWFVMRPQINYWRNHRPGHATALLLAWVPVTLFLVIFRREPLLHAWPAMGSAIVGFALLFFEAWIVWRVKRDVGASRLIARTELSDGGEFARQGIYARIRHPRYGGSVLAILGPCFLAGMRLMWTVAGIWRVLTLAAIVIKERELRARFGAAYEDYCRQVPRFVPMSIKPREA